ncbi:sensor histidine kinase [Marinihelvus fidelis]|uniref:Sensor histidine kinase n=1 Tax=Marinihelvus fidelis TaxID=2613842 RepID=A0A5N0T7Z1_9GAMM|nr:histidine kinase [Marinihelvus fidelis]KAA9130848.1 sensor histidine kinase [Marinihelvus fidelis]
MPRPVLPPSFCSWRALAAVAAVSLLATALVLLGRLDVLAPGRVVPVLVYGVALGVICALAVCVCRALLSRLSVRAAWLGGWLIVVLTTLGISYGVGVVGSVHGVGPGPNGLGLFMLQSVLATGVVTVALFRYLFIRAQWRAEMLAQADARVQALQARIRPHFLFNSLNTIASLIHDDPASAERATEDLADLFHGSMRRADKSIPLSDELELARKYLAMEKRRLGERLAVKWSMDGLPDNAMVLPMVLQPLLENAVGHGIGPRADGGEIQVFGRVEGQNLVITISNPLAPPRDHAGAGMALRNIRSRLDLAHGPRASLLTNRDGNRFYAVLTVPHVKDPGR